MKRLALTLFGVALLAVTATQAQAQATRTWVSGVGDDANPCSRTAPCKTFAGAISKTASAGFINCIDPGGFGQVTITKSITIDCANTQAGILTSGGSGVNVNGAGIVVTLRGLSIEGLGTATNGVNFITGAAVHIEDCRIVQFPNNGINFAVPTGVTAELYVTNSTIHENGTSTTTGGIVVKPAGTGRALVTINGANVKNNSTGIIIDGSASSGGLNAVIRDGLSSGNTNTGIAVSSAGNPVIAMIERMSVSNNATGISSNGANSTTLLTSNVVAGNTTIGLTATGGGLLTYTNNFVGGNGNDGATTGPISPK